MSFEAMTWAVKQRLPCTQKMVLLMLANRTNHDSGRCDPSIEALAKDCGLSARTVQAVLKELQTAGMLKVILRRSGKINKPNHYRLNLSVSTVGGGEGAAPPGEGDSPGVVKELHHPPGAAVSPPGEGAAPKPGIQPKALNQKKSPSEGKPRKRETTFDEWTTSLGDALAIPGDDPIFEWATKAGIPDDFVDLAWRWFEDRYAGDAKRYLDWRAVFRNAVRGNWGKVWWTPPGGGYALTTIGEQYRRVRDTEASEQAAREAA